MRWPIKTSNKILVIKMAENKLTIIPSESVKANPLINDVVKMNKMAQTIKNLKLIDNHENKGKGGVVKQGMLLAKGEYRIFTDADNSTPISELEKFLPYLKR